MFFQGFTHKLGVIIDCLESLVNGDQSLILFFLSFAILTI